MTSKRRRAVRHKVVSEDEAGLLELVRARLANPQPGIKVTLDDL